MGTLGDQEPRLGAKGNGGCWVNSGSIKPSGQVLLAARNLAGPGGAPIPRGGLESKAEGAGTLSLV